MTLRINPVGVLVVVLISALFSLAVYRIDHNAITKIAQVQATEQRTRATAERNGEKLAAVCRRDFVQINQAHDSLIAGFQLQARIAGDNIAGIDYATRNGLIPPSLTRYYAGVRRRQISNRDHFRKLAAGVHDLAPLC